MIRTIHITNFVRHQNPASGFTHWNISDAELLVRIEDNFSNHRIGYRDGVILVQIDPAGFYTGLVELKDEDRLIGEYKSRQAGEKPRKSIYSLKGSKLPARRVDVVLYHHDVLAEKGENETDADWEIVSVNGSPTDEETPIPTGALIANQLELSGGTATKMTNDEFVIALRKSVEFWHNKANLAPEHLR